MPTMHQRKHLKVKPSFHKAITVPGSFRENILSISGSDLYPKQKERSDICMISGSLAKAAV